MARQSISLTKPNEEWLKIQVNNEEYTSKSELINDLIRQARKQQVQVDFIRAKLVYSGRKQDFEDTIEMLKKSEPDTWLKLSDEERCEEFRLDKYGEPEYLYFDKPFKPCAKIFSTAIMLSNEGKIIMEEFGRQFDFFKYCIQETFSEFSIAKAIRVYISG